MKNIFEESVNNEVIARISALTNETQAKWGKMSVAQMMAHCSVAYEMVYENSHPPIGGFKKFMLKLFVKNIVVGSKPYKKNSRTAPEFLISDQRNFEKEKERLVSFINKTQELGEEYFDNKESRAFGNLSAMEWNNMFYKHIDHHLNQFGA